MTMPRVWGSLCVSLSTGRGNPRAASSGSIAAPVLSERCWESTEAGVGLVNAHARTIATNLVSAPSGRWAPHVRPHVCRLKAGDDTPCLRGTGLSSRRSPEGNVARSDRGRDRRPVRLIGLVPRSRAIWFGWPSLSQMAGLCREHVEGLQSRADGDKEEMPLPSLSETEAASPVWIKEGPAATLRSPGSDCVGASFLPQPGQGLPATAVGCHG